jgi:catechol 2,3-dioxygenase-like lactoylglutathione lyase family enzyme
MTESPVSEPVAQQWYLRPVLFVSDLQAALRFYIDKLGFEKRWHSGDGNGTVCQVNRGGCEVILCEDAARQDRGRLFIELNRDGIDELRREIAERAVPTGKVTRRMIGNARDDNANIRLSLYQWARHSEALSL